MGTDWRRAWIGAVAFVVVALLAGPSSAPGWTAVAVLAWCVAVVLLLAGAADLIDRRTP